MKNYNDVAKNVFERRDEYNALKSRKRRTVSRISSGMLCFCIVAIIGITTWQGGLFKGKPELPVTPSGGMSENNPSAAIIDSDGRASVYIPAVELPENSDYESKDMLGLIVYNGKIYMQAEYLHCDSGSYESVKQSFVDEYLGTASGTLDEWSSKEDFQKELASNAIGDVYSVKGYDKSFRICIPEMHEGCNFIAFFENLNDISLSTGKDLYADRLKLKDNYFEVLYQTHIDWDDGKDEYRQLAGVSEEDIAKFVDALYESEFEDLSDLSTAIYSQGLKQAHIYFKMNNGTTVGIRLFENGYVGYDNMYYKVFAKMENDAFDRIFSAATES